MNSHVFVAMPYGTKEGIDFNRVYSELIKPALEGEGFEVFRADEELSAGNIRTDMFQELLLADLVVADLSIDNPNVWYELGVRHALRARGVILIQCQRETQPFDVYTDRKLHYHVKEGGPDPGFLDEDKTAMAQMARETLAAWHGRKISPVYHHLSYLQEPDWKELQVKEPTEFWESFTLWKSRIEVARRCQRPEDILVLAEEAPAYALRTEAYQWAGKALMQMGRFSFALEQFEKALELAPDNLDSCQLKGVVLGRLKKPHQAKALLERVIAQHPEDAETWALLGRVEKDAWIDAWRWEGEAPEKRRQDAALEDALLREAITFYGKGFRYDPTHYYSGINAVTLMHLLEHLTGDADPFGERPAMEGGLRWAIQCALQKEPKSFWARVTLGDLEVLTGNAQTVERAYKTAVVAAQKDWFALDSSCQQLLLLNALGFRPPEVEAGLRVFDHALAKLESPWQPERVVLFSGHMIDAPDRAEPRFPAAKETEAVRAIAETLDDLGAGERDLALCGGACGGDLLFAEAALQRGMRLQLRIPFDIPAFFQKSVTFADPQWGNRFYAVKNDPRTTLFIMPEELGPLPKKANPYERNNLWQLYAALCWGKTPEKVHFVCLWNGQGGDGPGGTQHMLNAVKKRSGQVHVLDTNALW